MKAKQTTVTVQIFGENYRIKGVKNPEYIEILAGYLDKKMKEVAANTQLTSTNKIAVLAALNVADELHKNKNRFRTTNRRIKEKVQTLIRLIDAGK